MALTADRQKTDRSPRGIINTVRGIRIDNEKKSILVKFCRFIKPKFLEFWDFWDFFYFDFFDFWDFLGIFLKKSEGVRGFF